MFLAYDPSSLISELKALLKEDSRVSSGLRTPRSRSRSGLHTPVVKKSSGERSVGYYFDKLREHFYATNNKNRWAITCTPYVCIIYEGKVERHKIEFNGKDDSALVRNLYLMLDSCDYKVEVFLEKIKKREFEDFTDRGVDGNRLGTPPEYNKRANVFVLDK